MKIIKYYEYVHVDYDFYLKKIMSDARKGITPEESINDYSLFRKINSYYRYEIEIANKISIKRKYLLENKE
jgi:hypothetical protein